MERRRCSLCGGPVSKTNRIGICIRNPECARANEVEAQRQYRERQGILRRGLWHSPWESPVSDLVAPGAVMVKGEFVATRERADHRGAER
jgi:hypothetical protein